MGLNLLLIGLVILIFGISQFLPARTARKRDQIRESWSTAPGTVMSSEVVPQPPLMQRGKEILQYDVAVKYQFRSGGQLHFGSTVAYPRFLYTKAEAEKIVARYRAGATVTVHHNPEDIRECYLENQATAKNYRTSIVLMAAGALVMGFGLLQGMG